MYVASKWPANHKGHEQFLVTDFLLLAICYLCLNMHVCVYSCQKRSVKLDFVPETYRLDEPKDRQKFMETFKGMCHGLLLTTLTFVTLQTLKTVNYGNVLCLPVCFQQFVKKY